MLGGCTFGMGDRGSEGVLVRNQRGEPIEIRYRSSLGDGDVTAELPDKASEIITPRAFDDCTTDPMVALDASGEEIDRLDPGACWVEENPEWRVR